MPLPLGSWNINANGSLGTLTVTPDGMGGINGSVFGQPMVGFFDETARTVRFLRVMSPNLSTFQVYTGALFQFSTAPNTVTFTLAGNFEQFPPSGSVNSFSWFAQMAQKLKEKEKEAGKDNKDNKDSKDRKDNNDKDKEDKEFGKDGPKEQLDLVSPMSLLDVGTPLGQLIQRVNTLEQRLATGQAFIKPEERPPVGEQALQQSEAGEGTNR